MQNIRDTLNQIIRTNEHIYTTRSPNELLQTIHLTKPFSILGLNLQHWNELTSIVLSNWREEKITVDALLNDYFNANIKPIYESKIRALLPKDSLPTIILSIITQEQNELNLDFFKNQEITYPNIKSYLTLIQQILRTIPVTYSAVSSYVINAYMPKDEIAMYNGVSKIGWGGEFLDDTNDNSVVGLQHIWDHYDYRHVHVVDTFQQHKILLINAIRRTWLSSLSLSAGLKAAATRVNYGYMTTKLIPDYDIDQYNLLALLNYGVVILPPYNIERINKLTMEDIENIVLKSTKCLPFVPSLNIVYVTDVQLGQELKLGNVPIDGRYKVVSPLTYTNELLLYNKFTTNKIPKGLEFNVNELLMNINTSSIIPSYNLDVLSYPGGVTTSSFGISDVISKTPVFEVNYRNYLAIMKILTNGQYARSNLVKRIAPNGLTIESDSHGQTIIAFMTLNENIPGVNLNQVIGSTDSISSILTPSETTFIPDFTISSRLTDELLVFKEFKDYNFKDINVMILNPGVVPSTYVKLLNYNNIVNEVYSLDGSVGIKVDTLYSFSYTNANLIYMCITETEYLNDQTGFELFTTTIDKSKLYSIEFIDFNLQNLRIVLESLIESLLILSGAPNANMSFNSLLLCPYRVGVRVRFSVDEYPMILTKLSSVDDDLISRFTRNITPQSIVIEPIQSVTYKKSVVPRMGTYLVAKCQEKDFNKTLGYMSSLCRYSNVKSQYIAYNYYMFEGIVDQSRIVLLDRIKMFKENVELTPQQLLPQDTKVNEDRSVKLTYFELMTQTDRMLLYILRKEDGTIDNNLSDYGSADYLNVCMTNNVYTMYDLDEIDSMDIPGVEMVKGDLTWGQPLPYVSGDDVLIYNSIFFAQNQTQDTIAADIRNMLTGVLDANNVYFNLPYMNNLLYQLLLPLNIVTIKNNDYYLKLSNYPAVLCLNDDSINSILTIFPSSEWNVAKMSPSLLDYYFTSRMIQRFGVSDDYFNAIVLHAVVPLFVCKRL